MFLELIGTVIAGFAVAGVIMLLNRLAGRRLPRWLVPVAAGVGMILVTVSNEYTWFSRTTNALPEGFTVSDTVEAQSFYRPWTYARPFIERFAAVDTATIRTHPSQPGLKLTEVYFFGRWAPVNKLPVAADCPGMKRAALVDAIEFETDGTLSGADWLSVPADDAILKTICEAS